MNLTSLKAEIAQNSPDFFANLAEAARQADSFEELFALAALRKRALAKGIAPRELSNLRLALIGGYTFTPFISILELLLSVNGFDLELYTGDYGSDTADILNPASALYAFHPDLVFWMPSDQTCRYEGSLLAPRESQQSAALTFVHNLLSRCELLNSRSKSEIVLTNFSLPSRCDLGPFRTRTLGSEWSFKKLVNLELGLAAPAFVHLHDLEYLGNRLGALCFDNPQGYFESKQPGSPIFLVRLAQELSHLILSLRKPSKKVLVLDLDNTLWGGVIGDDGLEGIELGDTSPRAEAFKSFQKYIKTLASRGILLAVCSKNNEDIALQPFDHHPEMVLSRKDIASFKANWLPKSENLKQIATELNLGLDSLVFVDDNPAEIDLVRQFLPQVEAVLLGPDPADYIAQLKNRRLFEVNHLTSEDAQRSQSYQAERSRIELRNVAPDLPSYWASLEMRASFQPFSKVDAPRIAQLINKSNQFNTTTKRRSEAEVAALIDCDRYVTIATRLADRFGDHGLIGVIIGLIQDDRLEIDTWLISCRVLQRQVEHESLNKLVRLAQCRGCRQILAQYIRTPKNNLVSNLFPSLGFTALSASEFMLDVDAYVPHSTHIRS